MVEIDMKLTERTYEEVEMTAEDRLVRRSCVAQCAGGTGQNKV